MAVGRNYGGKGMLGPLSRPSKLVEKKKRSLIALSAADSAAEWKRDGEVIGYVRPYVRTSAHKLRWTQELHVCFLRAVKTLGGPEVATPKRILQVMDQEGITMGHVKSHLQMYRTGKINEPGLPVCDARDPVQFRPIVKELTPRQEEKLQQEAREVHLALQLLKEGRVSGADGFQEQLKSIADIKAFQRFTDLAPDAAKTRLEERNSKTRNLFPEIDFVSSKKEEIDTQEGEESRRGDKMELDLSMAPPRATPLPSPLCLSTATSTPGEPDQPSLSLSLSI